MVREEEITRITELLGQNTEGLTIEQVSRQLSINRTTAAKYLNFLIASGQIRKRNLGPAKIFTLSPRLPMSNFLNLWQDGIVILNNDLAIQQINDPLIELLSLNRDDLIGKRIEKSSLAQFIDTATMGLLEKAHDGEEQVHYTAFSLHGREEKFRIKMIPLVLDLGGRGLGLIFEHLSSISDGKRDQGSGKMADAKEGEPEPADLQLRETEHKKVEKALAESEAKYRALVENISEVIFTLNDHDLITYVSPAIRNLTGHAPADLMGKRLQEFIYPEDTVPFERGLDIARKGVSGPFECRILTLHSSVTWVQISGKPLAEKPGPGGFHGVIADINERKRVEDALRHATRQIILLNSITRHDILNGIMNLRLSSELIKSEPLTEKQRHLVEQQETVIAQIQHQINFTRYYQNIGVRPPRWNDIGERFSIAAGSVPHASVQVITEVKNIEVFSDDMIERVFTNLIENTMEHGSRATTIRFSGEPREKDLVLVYEDNGVGIPVEEKELIFEHTRRGRISYGLFFSREVLAITGLSMKENGEPGKGVRFEILVPEGLFR